MKLVEFLPQEIVQSIEGYNEANWALVKFFPGESDEILQDLTRNPFNLEVPEDEIARFSKDNWEAIFKFFQNRTKLVNEYLKETTPRNGETSEIISSKEKITPTEKAYRLCCLLKEFTSQWGEFEEQAKRIVLNQDETIIDEGREKEIVQFRARRILPAAEQLAREASGLVENAKLDDLDRTELRVRLADFEAMLHTLRLVADLNLLKAQPS